MAVGLNHYLILSAVLFCIGLFGALTRRNPIAILMCTEIMLNATNIAMVAFARYVTPVQLTGQLFTVLVMVVAAAEGAVGLAMIISIYRHYRAVDTEKTNVLKG